MTEDLIPADARALTGADAAARQWRRARLLLAMQVRARPIATAVGAVLLGALALSLPILANGRPFPFTDTATYFQVGYNIIQRIFTDAGVPISDFSRAYLAARSPYYGLLITMVEWAGTLWLVVALNAVVSAVMLRILARAMAPQRPLTVYACLIAMLSVFSALPLFVGFVMPDLTAAFTALSIALLLFYPDRLARWERRFLWIMLAAALAFHTTHVMLALLVAPAAVALHHLIRAPDLANRAPPIMGAIAAGIGAWVLFYGLNAQSSQPYNSPPFLTARVLADGPGRVYLRKQCAANANAFALCPFRNKALDNTDTILWGWRNEKGVFAVASKETRLAIIHEQGRFVTGAILSDPLGEAAAAIRNFLTQIVTVGVDEGFRLDAHYWMTYPPDFYLKQMAIRAGLCPEPLRKCPARIPLQVFAVWHMACLGLASLYLAIWSFTAWRDRAILSEDKRLFVSFAAVLVIAVLANAAVCGILSGPFPRYQARIAWLLIALALLAEMLFPVAVPAAREWWEKRRAPAAPAS
jgi:hypothetical protein